MITKKRNNFRSEIIAFILLFPQFKPDCFDYYFLSAGRIYDILRIIAALAALLLFLSRKIKIPESLWYFVLMYSLIIFSAIINHKNVMMAIIKLLSNVAIFVIFLLYLDDITSFLHSLLLILEISIVLNTFSVFKYQEKGMFQIGSTPYYFLGNRNSFIFYFVLAISVSIFLFGAQKRYTHTIVIVGLAFASIIKTGSATSLIAIVILLILLNLSEDIYTFKYAKLLVLFYFIVNIVLYFAQDESFLPIINWFVNDFLKRDTTFTDRVYIWESAMKTIKNHWLIGAGLGSGAVIRGTIHGAHNQLLELLIEGGIIVAFQYYKFIFCGLKHTISCDVNPKVRKTLYATITVLLIEFLMETYTTPLTFLPIFMCYFSEYIKE